MKIALGLKAHSGWAAMVVIGAVGKNFQVIDRRRIELVEENDRWAKQPYHAAQRLAANDAETLVRRGIQCAERKALKQIRTAVKRLLQQGYELKQCAILTPASMPNWSTAEILAVHFRMHQAEGVMFPAALAQAAAKCDLPVFNVNEKSLPADAARVLRTTPTQLTTTLAALGKSVGPPWGRDQKNAALAAMMSLAR